MFVRQFSIVTIAVLLLTSVASGARASGGAPFDGRRFDASITPYVRQLMIHDHVPGAQIAVVSDGRMVWSRSFGWSDIAKRIPVYNQTVFRAASISKLFTTTAIMRQVEAGRIGLDDDVNSYLDPPYRIRNAEGKETKVTLRQLLSHMSGLPVSWRGIGGTFYTLRTQIPMGISPPSVSTLENFLPGLELEHKPGGYVVYSNDGFMLVGYLVERLAKEDFAIYVRKNIFVPLGMSSSDFITTPQLRTRLSVPYLGRRFFPVNYGRTAVPGVQPNPAGSLITTAPDLARFAMMVISGGELDGGRILKASTLEEMGKLHARQDPALDFGFGAGFMVGQYRGHHVIGHDGGLAGVSTRLAIMPDEKLAVAVMTNSDSGEFTHRVVDTIFDQLLHESSSFDPKKAKRDPVPEKWLQLCGHYRLVDFVPPQLAVLGRAVQARLYVDRGLLKFRGGGSRWVLEPTKSDEVFVLHGQPAEGERIVFRRKGNQLTAAADMLRLERVPWYASFPAMVIWGLLALAILLFAGWRLFQIARRGYRSRSVRAPLPYLR
jgi:CubicO group peptidase (beta-lactamase class C family)